jgi:hypothetical protein
MVQHFLSLQAKMNGLKMSSEKRWAVWVGGIEVNDYLLTKDQAERVANFYREDGYDDVAIEEVKVSH